MRYAVQAGSRTEMTGEMQDRMKEEFLHCCFHLFTLSKSKVFNNTIQYCTCICVVREIKI